jgi:hypothetical protein
LVLFPFGRDGNGGGASADDTFDFLYSRDGIGGVFDEFFDDVFDEFFDEFSGEVFDEVFDDIYLYNEYIINLTFSIVLSDIVFPCHKPK